MVTRKEIDSSYHAFEESLLSLEPHVQDTEKYDSLYRTSLEFRLLTNAYVAEKDVEHVMTMFKYVEALQAEHDARVSSTYGHDQDVST